ncbi:hypothetical protein BofuT4_uP034100.1 [Botrytis cinerea T4]|uniref:Uncharacterized protein n=1 Tax=Botryotinia fuckeliana (strain T4) TaxID=999810 RepID=G2Y840_BOTF4|nr:hypothetical protein BofuT4_uP034100.1 [Botrytis cinerea T4]
MAEWALQVNKPSVHHAQIHDLELTARGLITWVTQYNVNDFIDWNMRLSQSLLSK